MRLKNETGRGVQFQGDSRPVVIPWRPIYRSLLINSPTERRPVDPARRTVYPFKTRGHCHRVPPCPYTLFTTPTVHGRK